MAKKFKIPTLALVQKVKSTLSHPEYEVPLILSQLRDRFSLVNSSKNTG
jgi:hypothetical protein